jgi:hypothetical protein
MTVKEVWDSKNEGGREPESMKGLQMILVASLTLHAGIYLSRNFSKFPEPLNYKAK